jgi:hypothetical protein
LQRHLQQHGTFKRSLAWYAIYIRSTSLLCDPRVYAQWCQGVLTCYLSTLWLLGVDQLPLKKTIYKWQHHGPPAALCSSRAIVMQMSVAGMHALRAYEPPYAGVHGQEGQRQHQQDCRATCRQCKGWGIEGACV